MDELDRVKHFSQDFPLVRAVVIIDHGDGNLSGTLGTIHDGEWEVYRDVYEVPSSGPMREFVGGDNWLTIRVKMLNPRSIVRKGNLDDFFSEGWTEQPQQPEPKGLPSAEQG